MVSELLSYRVTDTLFCSENPECRGESLDVVSELSEAMEKCLDSVIGKGGTDGETLWKPPPILEVFG